MTQGWLCSFPFANKAKTRRKIVQKKKKMKLWGGEGWWSKTSLYMVCCVSMCTLCCTALSVHQPSTYMYTHTSTARTKTHASHRTHSSHTVFSSPTWLHYPSPVPLAHHITYSPPNNHFIQPLDIITPQKLVRVICFIHQSIGGEGVLHIHCYGEAIVCRSSKRGCLTMLVWQNLKHWQHSIPANTIPKSTDRNSLFSHWRSPNLLLHAFAFYGYYLQEK